ncbi:MAG: hypothetical protein MUE50_00115 [Pirellulaceae bacterium]|nr:hypothetical protein [Pirellulaceae bacterium]
MLLPKQAPPVSRRDFSRSGRVGPPLEITVRVCNGLAKPLTVAVAAGCQTLRGGFTVQGGCGSDPPCKPTQVTR